jgi:hypothetical protein
MANKHTHANAIVACVNYTNLPLNIHVLPEETKSILAKLRIIFYEEW